MSETQLKSTEASLQPWVEDALVKLHKRKTVSMNSSYTPWTIEEDRLLLRLQMQAGGPAGASESAAAPSRPLHIGRVLPSVRSTSSWTAC